MATQPAFKIEKGVPIPGGRHKYPFAQMEIGDSFEVTGEDMRKIYSAASNSGGRHGRSYRTRVTENGIRVWRTA